MAMILIFYTAAPVFLFSASISRNCSVSSVFFLGLTVSLTKGSLPPWINSFAPYFSVAFIRPNPLRPFFSANLNSILFSC